MAGLSGRDRAHLADLRVMATARAYWRAARRSGGHLGATRLHGALVSLLGGSEWVARGVIERVRGLDTVRVTLVCGHRYTRYLDAGKLDARPDLVKLGDLVFCLACPRSAAPSTVTRVVVNGREWRHDRVSLRCGHFVWRARWATECPVSSVGDVARCGECLGQPRTVVQVWTPTVPLAA